MEDTSMRDKTPMQKATILCSLLLAFTVLPILITPAELQMGSDILLIYSSGTPLEYYTKKSLFRTIRERQPKEVDAVTTATPAHENCRTISGKLGLRLREKGLKVRVANAKDIRDRSEILSSGLVIIGTPSRFWNVSWEIKKLFDEQFSKIGALEEKQLNKLRVAGFSMAEIEPSAKAALKAIKATVNDCNGRFGPTTFFLTKHSEKQINKRINKFAEKLLDCLDRD
jgi:hypothetical protein